MRAIQPVPKMLLIVLCLLTILSCDNTTSGPPKEVISQLNLKKGDLISCGVKDPQFGVAEFETSCEEKTKEDFNLAVELLHSFEYDESEKVFAKIIDQSPGCAMAYWGIAMSNFHPLWTPPNEAELQKGAKAIDIAKAIPKKSEREAGYINAIGLFYKDWKKTDHYTRCVNFEKAMEKLHGSYPEDPEAAIFYALALNAAASPSDKTYKKQKKAAEILNALYTDAPNHPGIIHYIIHTYDYPELATLALPAARKYASVAPSSAHALHMPSHIFIRLGLWQESINSNQQSMDAAKCYAQSAGIKGHWDEELHGLDYMVYAALQKGENNLAKKQVDYLNSITEVYPVNFKVAYAFAASPSRYLLENKNWREAAILELRPSNFGWNKFPWQEAIVHFTRLLGAAHLRNIDSAKAELTTLNRLRDTLEKQKDNYASKQVAIQIKGGEAWIEFALGNSAKALDLMNLAAAMEDSTGKHPVTPGEVLPARELLGDMYFALNENEHALSAYEAVLAKAPNRFNSLYGAGKAAQKLGNQEKAVAFYEQLLSLKNSADCNRPEFAEASRFLAMNS